MRLRHPAHGAWSRNATLCRWDERRSEQELADDRRRKNAVSIDGLPALDHEPIT
ncbi:hypothetical protein [Egicoccus halophilus]|uniref:hypothetical protein n=1 Tax=Egicoccus halophilus TaxID=1670830 RepID=UPI0013EEE535|nr:hypothetical protein [Egicoccus halophilus]